MATRIFSVTSWTPTATADTANLADNTHMAVQGGTTTQRLIIHEIYIGGQAAASAPNFMILSRDSQVGTGALTYVADQSMDAPNDPDTAALAAAPATFTAAATNKPQRSSTLHLQNLTHNAFGGIVRMNFPPDSWQKPIIRGNAATAGEVTLSCITTGGGLVGSHIVYEPL